MSVIPESTTVHVALTAAAASGRMSGGTSLKAHLVSRAVPCRWSRGEWYLQAYLQAPHLERCGWPGAREAARWGELPPEPG